MVTPASALSELQAHTLELLSPLGPARARRMFGGAGVYLDGHFIALIADEVLYLRADAQAQAAFQAASSQPFCYSTKNGRRTVMAYWSAPEAALESPAQMRPWALLALESALRAAAAKRPAAPRKVRSPVGQAGAVPAGRPATAKRRKAGA